MTPVQVAANPFALMTNPEAVFAAMARSDRLQRLTSRMCRPLDKVMQPKSEDAEGSEGSTAESLIDDSIGASSEACEGIFDAE
jgi:hypothetical protein